MGTAVRPALVKRAEQPAASGPPRRTRIWEFNTNLHCSIVGTCLSTAELRQLLKKLCIAAPDSSDHELHAAAVSLAGNHDKPAKLLHKTLDDRHRLAINRFARVEADGELRTLWNEAVQGGDIPGAYWATLTHPAASRELVRDAFNEVHMLSHLVGAANRADIRRLRALEAETAELRARLDRQQLATRDAIVSRDGQIRALRQALAQQVPAGQTIQAEDGAALRQVIADLERRLAAARRSAALQERLRMSAATLAGERSARTQAERDAAALRHELELIESSVLAERGLCAEPQPVPPDLRGITLLYVGGRPNQTAHLRYAAEETGAAFLHHDGGLEDHLTLLPGLTRQADLVLFPVDCVSHPAAQAVKTLCRQGGKRFMPLRSASVTAMLAALRQPEIAAVAEAAD